MNRLFRHMVTLTLVGLILSVASCTYDDSIRNLREPKHGESMAIAFSNGIIDSPVTMYTRALALLSDHMESMGVWGWQTTQEGVTERLFQNQNVTFSTSLDKSLRQNDYPTAENRDEFTRYIVRLENYDEIVFLCHKTTGKWWMEISDHFIPCSKSDYDLAMQNELPDRWWQFYQKLM